MAQLWIVRPKKAMIKTPNQDFNDIRNSSTIGLALGALVFLGLGFSFVFGVISDCRRIISGSGPTETFVEWLIVIIVSLMMLIWGLMFIVIGAFCFYHFFLRWKLKRELRGKMNKNGDLA
jgi:hypothetical protein